MIKLEVEIQSKPHVSIPENTCLPVGISSVHKIYIYIGTKSQRDVYIAIFWGSSYSMGVVRKLRDQNGTRTCRTAAANHKYN